jgi:multidrug efflux pump subunit AcrB
VLLGVILLAGIVTNNAILLVEYVELARERGVPAEQAVVEAGAVRLRPIVMTTLTTILGMLPLAIGLGEGSEMMQPLAIAVIGGLSISTLLTLVVIPCSYLVIKGAAERLRSWVLGSREDAVPTAAD